MSPRRLDLINQRFGRWVVLRKSQHKGANGEIYWLCCCECGTERDVKAALLKRRESQSCGCYHREAVTKHGMTLTRTWKSWNSMLQRCENSLAPDYEQYGGRGIKICQRWHVFKSFLDDLGERPDGMTLDRINVDGHYEPGNVRWAASSKQQRNKRNAILATVSGVTKSIHDWAEESGIPSDVIKWRLSKGWSHAEAISQPVRPKRPNLKD